MFAAPSQATGIENTRPATVASVAMTTVSIAGRQSSETTLPSSSVKRRSVSSSELADAAPVSVLLEAVSRGRPAVLADADPVRVLEGVRGPHVGAVDLGDVELAGRRGAAQVDRGRVAPVAVAVDDREGELAPALVAGRDGVEERKGPEVGDVVHAAERPLLRSGGRS